MKNCFGPVTSSNNLRRFATGPVHCLKKTDKSSSPSPLGILLLRRQPPVLLLLRRALFLAIGSRVVLGKPGCDDDAVRADDDDDDADNDDADERW